MSCGDDDFAVVVAFFQSRCLGSGILTALDPGAVGKGGDLRFVETATAFVADVFGAGLRDFGSRDAQTR